MRLWEKIQEHNLIPRLFIQNTTSRQLCIRKNETLLNLINHQQKTDENFLYGKHLNARVSHKIRDKVCQIHFTDLKISL